MKKLPLLEFKRKEITGDRIYACPLCGDEVTVPSYCFFGRCASCLATIIDYRPEDHQYEFHASGAKFKLNLGGYGSGKTTQGAAEIVSHALSVRNGRTVIVAQSLQQVREAALPELEKFLPPWFITKSVKTPLPRYTLQNGHEILVYASDDEEKLRSLNITSFWIIEASKVKFKIFVQLKSRLRNTAALVLDELGMEIGDNFLGIVESNPEEGWIVDEFLLRSQQIFASKSVDIENYKKLKKKDTDKNYNAFLSASVDNKYLPKDFIRDLCVGQSDRWVRKYIYCYLETKEGLVYPDYLKNMIDPFPIPDNWLRIYGFDKGWSDATCLICGAIDPAQGICYIYDEYYMAQKPISYHGAQIKEKVFGHNMYKGIQADPAVMQKSDRDGLSYRDYMYNVSGVVLELANNSILDGIDRVRDFMYLGKLKFMTNCVNTKEEALRYCWKEDKEGTQKDSPIDRFNHLMDSLRYLVMGLPIDLTKVGYAETEVTKDNILSRITPFTDMKDLYGERKDVQGGAYGLEVLDYDSR